MLYSPESKAQCQKIVDHVRKVFRASSYRFSEDEREVIALAISTMYFFLEDTIPFDTVAINRIDEEVGVFHKITRRHGMKF